MNLQASLRSTLTPDDDETELVPHVKGVTEFEIFEEVLFFLFLIYDFFIVYIPSVPSLQIQVLMSPRHTVLPWDSRTQPPYTLSYKVAFSQFSSLQILFFQVSGGGRVYGYSL